MIDYYTDIKPRVDLSVHHFKKSCRRGKCVIRDGELISKCERHLDTAAIVRRYLKLKKFRKEKLRQAVTLLTEAKSLTEARIQQTLGTYNHADRTEWRRRFPI